MDNYEEDRNGLNNMMMDRERLVNTLILRSQKVSLGNITMTKAYLRLQVLLTRYLPLAGSDLSPNSKVRISYTEGNSMTLARYLRENSKLTMKIKLMGSCGSSKKMAHLTNLRWREFKVGTSSIFC